MPERHGYIPGVPCWVDASEPEPEAAVEFYSGLLGWEFEGMTPPGSEDHYFIARLPTKVHLRVRPRRRRSDRPEVSATDGDVEHLCVGR